jgi:hypothetical protein
MQSNGSEYGILCPKLSVISVFDLVCNNWFTGISDIDLWV